MELKVAAQQILGLIDLTSLNVEDTPETILALCQQAHSEFGSVAAICIFPQFIPVAKKYLTSKNLALKIATVVNFPSGSADLANALKQTHEALDLGADEVDLVFPYSALMTGDQQIGATMVKQAKQICGRKTLKVIIESGVLHDPHLIKLASEIAIANGADFIKTSTGKVPINATLAATAIMLKAIKDAHSSCGFKAAGGIRRVSEAVAYLELSAQIMGDEWINARNFRFGASSLVTEVLNTLRGQASNLAKNAY